MKQIKAILSAVAALVLVGCAHPITLSPDMQKIDAQASANKINKNVAYYIADDQRTKEITTPGGGGDKVSYLPYRDLETAFYKMLSNVFPSVTKLKSPTDAEAINKDNVAYVITPKIETDSHSPSAFTWPPTRFNVVLTCDIADAKGNPVITQKVDGEGKAEFDEFKLDHSLSAKRASEDAMLKMQQALLNAAELKK